MNNNNNEEVEITVMEAFDLTWFKFVEWGCGESKVHLPKETAELVESSIRRPPMLALITLNDMLRERPHTKDYPEWKEVEKRRKVITDRDESTLMKAVLQLLAVPSLEIPDRVKSKFFDYANVMLGLIDEMNETPK